MFVPSDVCLRGRLGFKDGFYFVFGMCSMVISTILRSLQSSNGAHQTSCAVTTRVDVRGQQDRAEYSGFGWWWWGGRGGVIGGWSERAQGFI